VTPPSNFIGLTSEQQAKVVQSWATVVITRGNSREAGDAMDEDEESSEDENVEGNERMGPSYTGLRCMA
jgi:hypothetical protein